MECRNNNTMRIIDGYSKWEVEKILDVKFSNNGASYLVKWVSDFDDTWEPSGNLINTPILLGKFSDRCY